jgi:uncharacterized protein YegL
LKIPQDLVIRVITDDIIDRVINGGTDTYHMALPQTAATRIAGIIPPSPSVSQLGILMLDGSGSMADENAPGSGVTKADAVLSATRDFVEVLKASRLKDSFWLAANAFSISTTNMLPISRDYIKITDLDPTAIRSPTAVFPAKQNTDIVLALTKASEIMGGFLRDSTIPVDSKYRKVVVILLSDGLHNVGEVDEVYGRAQEISSMWPFCTVAFGNSANVNLLRGIVVDERYFLQTADSNKLRSFFVNSTTRERR